MWKGLVVLPLHCVWTWPWPQPPLQPGHCSVSPVLIPVCVCVLLCACVCVCVCVCVLLRKCLSIIHKAVPLPHTDVFSPFFSPHFTLFPLHPSQPPPTCLPSTTPTSLRPLTATPFPL